MIIIIDDLTGPEIASFLEEHLEDMRATSPPESKHALDLDGLRDKSVTFWSVYDTDQLVACGALKDLGDHQAEIKSMRTSASVRGKGVASRLLQHIIDFAREKAFTIIRLETGSMDYFKPAHGLYRKFGFVECAPFGSYSLDPNSLFFELRLSQSEQSI